MMKKRLIPVCLLLGFWSRLASQTIQFPVEHFTSEHGLSQNSVFCIYQDSRGFLWLGNEYGLNRYDGYRFTVFSHDDANPESLSDSFVRDIREDKEGFLWLATANGLNRFDPVTGKSVRFHHDAANPNSLSHDAVYCLHIQRSNPDFLWVGTTKGLNRLDKKNGNFTRFTADAKPGSLLNDKILSIYEDSYGNLWIGTSQGLYHYSPESSVFSFKAPSYAGGTASAPVSAINEPAYTPGILWIGTSGQGLFRFEPAKAAWKNFRTDPRKEDSLNSNVVTAISEYSGLPGSLIIGTDTGLCRFDPAHELFTRIGLSFANNEIQNRQAIRALFQDDSGVFWIGTNNDGLDKFIPVRKNFTLHRPYPDSLPNAMANFITTLYQTRDGRIFVTTFRGGAFFFDRTSDSFHRFFIDAKNPERVMNSIITHAIVTRDGMMWFATGEGLVRYDQAGPKLTIFQHDPADPHTISDSFISMFLEDASGLIWVGTLNGLNQLDPKTGRVTRFQHDRNNPQSLSNNVVNIVFADRDGDIWIATNEGLNLFNSATGGFKRFFKDPQNLDTLCHNLINALWQDSRGRIWICTAGGLNLLEKREGKITFKRLLTPSGTPNQNSIRAIAEENDRIFWLSTLAGLARLDVEMASFTFYGSQDGVTAEEFTEGLCLRTLDGELFFGGKNGFLSFRPEKMTINRHAPPLAFTDFKIGTRQISNYSVPWPSPLNPQNGLIIPWKQNAFTVEFTALDFVHPSQNQYAYRLEGRDSEWTYLGFENRITMTNTKTGTYILRVKAANSDGIWNKQGISLPVTIVPPFWKTTGFQAFLLILLLAIAAFIVLLRRKYTARKPLDIPQDLRSILAKYNISKRELEIIKLVVKGNSNKQIEDELFISIKTVKSHLYNVYQKLKVKNRLELINLILREVKRAGEHKPSAGS